MANEGQEAKEYMNIAPEPDVLVVAVLRELETVLAGPLAKAVRVRVERARAMQADYATCLERLWAAGREIPWKDPNPRA